MGESGGVAGVLTIEYLATNKFGTPLYGGPGAVVLTNF